MWSQAFVLALLSTIAIASHDVPSSDPEYSLWLQNASVPSSPAVTKTKELIQRVFCNNSGHTSHASRTLQLACDELMQSASKLLAQPVLAAASPNDVGTVTIQAEQEQWPLGSDYQISVNDGKLVLSASGEIGRAHV